jgi:hypothetical protein
VTAPMNVHDLECDATTLLRLARTYLSRDVLSVHIDATGIAIAVANEETARRLAEAHGMNRAAKSSLVAMWTGDIGNAAVSIRIGEVAIPTQRTGV